MKSTATMTTRPKRLAKRLASGFLLGVCLFCSVACPANRTPVNLQFSATWAGQPLHCGKSELSLTDLRFFVSDVVLFDAAGVEYPLFLTVDGRWQQGGIALIDLENGEGGCLNGTQEMHTELSGTAEISDFDGVRFTIGVPFESNHANPLLAKAPLDDAAMHWHWRSGYKFLRAGVASKSDSFWMHLGSTACEGTVQNITACRSPNRVTVELSGLSANENRIEVDLSVLFDGVDLDDGLRSDCSSGPAETACAAPFDALGLPFGEQRNTSRPHSVFQAGY
jgi:uncharacterized repeat protein (TIGR04052 family)